MPDYFIKGAIKHPGALRAYVMRKYGKEGFTEDGNIKQEIINEIGTEKGVEGKRARFAKTLRRIRLRNKEVVY